MSCTTPGKTKQLELPPWQQYVCRLGDRCHMISDVQQYADDSLPDWLKPDLPAQTYPDQNIAIKLRMTVAAGQRDGVAGVDTISGKTNLDSGTTKSEAKLTASNFVHSQSCPNLSSYGVTTDARANPDQHSTSQGKPATPGCVQTRIQDKILADIAEETANSTTGAASALQASTTFINPNLSQTGSPDLNIASSNKETYKPTLAYSRANIRLRDPYGNNKDVRYNDLMRFYHQGDAGATDTFRYKGFSGITLSNGDLSTWQPVPYSVTGSDVNVTYTRRGRSRGLGEILPSMDRSRGRRYSRDSPKAAKTATHGHRNVHRLGEAFPHHDSAAGHDNFAMGKVTMGDCFGYLCR